MRKLSLVFCVFLSAAVVWPARPNIIYILADDLGIGDLGCYGQKVIRTPSIDALAEEGMLFTQHYSGSTVCAPSRGSLMTGLHTGHSFIRDNFPIPGGGQLPLPEGTQTIATQLKKAGYATACIGKWGLGYTGTAGDPTRQGFDYFYGFKGQKNAHSYYPEFVWRNDEKVALEGEKYVHDEMMKEAMGYLENHASAANAEQQSEPFFLFLALTIPHADLDVPDDSMAEYANLEPGKPYRGEKGNYQHQEQPRKAFAGMVTRMDRDIGKLMSRLKALGLDETTLVAFSSDNGAHLEGGADPEFFDSNGIFRGFKRDLTEGGIRVPMIVRWPGKIEAGSVNRFVNAFWDVMPTLCEFGDAPVPANIDGISMLPSILGYGNQKQHEALYWEFSSRGGMQAIRRGDWKLIRTELQKPDGPKVNLYDLQNDPSEAVDLAANHPEVVGELLAKMGTMRTDSEAFPLFDKKTKTRK